MLLEAVPNLSLGRDEGALGRVVADVRRLEGPRARLLDVHTDWDHHRTVLTLAGAPAELVALVQGLAGSAVRHATIQGHTGVHPRIGLLDVVPFVPLQGASTEDAVAAAHATGALLADGMGIPVYHYAGCATGERARLATYRRATHRLGEALRTDLPPDRGPRAPHPRAGAACVGARGPMVAYNVLVEGAEAGAREIASRLRERDGGLPGVESLVFYLPRRRALQVSCNLRRPLETTPADVFAAVTAHAHELGLAVRGAELVGLAPRAAMTRGAAAAGLPRRHRALEDALAVAGLAGLARA